MRKLQEILQRNSKPLFSTLKMRKLTNDTLRINTSTKSGCYMDLTNHLLVASSVFLPHQFLQLRATSSALKFRSELQRIKNRKTYVHPIATLKTYTFSTFKVKQFRQKKKTRPLSELTIFEKLKKIYRETISIKTRKTIMKKKKDCHLVGEDKEAVVEVLIKDKWNAAKLPLKIDPVLSKYILKQAEKKEFLDPNIPLGSPCYPYIPCPLQQTEAYLPNNIKDYKHTTLAPLFTVDPLLTNKNQKTYQEDYYDKNGIKNKCISISFWSQFSSNKNKSNPEAVVFTSSSTVEEERNDAIAEDKALTSTSENSCDANECSDVSNNILKSNKEVKDVAALTSNDLTKETVQIPGVTMKESISFIPDKNIMNTTAEKTKLQKGKEHIKVTKSTIVKKKDLLLYNNKRKQLQNSKYLNLNMHYQMTSPNQIKNLKIAKNKLTTDNISKQLLNEKKEKVDIPKYTNNKLLKKIKKYYESDSSRNKGNLNKENTEFGKVKKVMEHIAQPMNSCNNSYKIHYPLTSPNSKYLKNKS